LHDEQKLEDGYLHQKAEKKKTQTGTPNQANRRPRLRPDVILLDLKRGRRLENWKILGGMNMSVLEVLH
jgi:hypothetical protein